MNWFLDWLKPQQDLLGDNLREAAATIIMRALEDDLPDDKIWTLSVWGGTIRGVPVGNWKLSARRIEARSDETLQAAQPERREPGPKDAPNTNREVV